MLTVGEYNFDSVQGYDDSLKEILKKTMLSQEALFRKQVHELHQLYGIQKILMQDSCWKEPDGYNLWKSRTLEFTHPIQNTSMANVKTIFSCPVVSSIHLVGEDYLEETNSEDFKILRRTSDLQHPVNQHVNHVDSNVIDKGVCDFRESMGLKHQFRGDTYSSVEVLELTLSTGGDKCKKARHERAWHAETTESSSHTIIDLVDPTDTITNEDTKSVSTLCCNPPLITVDKHELGVDIHSNGVSGKSVKKDLCELTLSHCIVDGNESCEEGNSSTQGVEEQHSDIARSCIFTKGTLFSHEAIGLDLNRTQLDNSSDLNDPLVSSLSTVGSSCPLDGLMDKFYKATCPASNSWQTPSANYFNEPSSSFLQEDDDPDSNNNSLKSGARSTVCTGSSGSETCHVDMLPMVGVLSDICKDHNSNHRNSGTANGDLLSNFPEGNLDDIIMEEVIEIGEEDVLFSHTTKKESRVENANGNKSPTSTRVDSVIDNSFSGAMTVQSRTELGGLNISPLNQFQKAESSKVAETQSGEQDLRFPDSCKFKDQCCTNNTEESGGDLVIWNAAESLIAFSLGSSKTVQECPGKAGTDEGVNKGRVSPQCSIDSYESIVLKLEESSVDDNSVSSKAFEVHDLDTKDCRLKLRRGRRLKDFQKDILPALASLARHEILEDISIMKTAIRSREYKRMRSKMAGGGNWFAPVKSRRSRLSYVGRRYY